MNTNRVPNFYVTEFTIDHPDR